MSVPPSKGSPSLLLLPTAVEAHRFVDMGGIEPGRALSQLCGFGPVAAAARTAQLLASLRPARVCLAGIAGTYDPERAPAGSAIVFTRVALEGVGVGEGESFQGPPALGFPQWPGTKSTPAIQEVLPVACPPGTEAALLLTTCAASASPEHACQRLARFPTALAEDMEGFGVALACALYDTPLAIVRGISNLVGARDPGSWKIPAALAAARRAVLEVLDCDWGR